MGKDSKTLGAIIKRCDGTTKYENRVDGGGCETPKGNNVKIYGSDNIAKINIQKGVKKLYMSGNWMPKRWGYKKRFTKESYDELIDIKLSNTVEDVDLWCMGNIDILEIPKNVKTLTINYCDISMIKFHKDCNLNEIIFNCIDINLLGTGKAKGKFPKVSKFSSYLSKFYSVIEIPDSETILTGNIFCKVQKGEAMYDVEQHFGDNLFELKENNSWLRGKVQIIKSDETYYGFGSKFDENNLIKLCSEIGMVEVLNHFGLQTNYPIKRHSFCLKNGIFDKYYAQTNSHSISAYCGSPVILRRFEIPIRKISVSGYIDFIRIQAYFNIKTQSIDYIDDKSIIDVSLTRERYDDTIKLLKMYYGEKWLTKVECGDFTSDDGLFSGTMLHDTDYEFKTITKTTIDKLDWSLMPDNCNVLTMNKNGEWWGNEHDFGLDPSGGRWKTSGGTGERWVNICEDVAIEIEPIEDWSIKQIRPKDQKITPKPKEFTGVELCMFSGSGGNPDTPRNICSRTENGARGDCSTCRVAAEWEEIFG